MRSRSSQNPLSCLDCLAVCSVLFCFFACCMLLSRSLALHNLTTLSDLWPGATAAHSEVHTPRLSAVTSSCTSTCSDRFIFRIRHLLSRHLTRFARLPAILFPPLACSCSTSLRTSEHSSVGNVCGQVRAVQCSAVAAAKRAVPCP